MAFYDNYGWRPYVSVAQRRRNAEREVQKLAKQGHPVSPVVIEGRTIASTFWGKAWCDNLEGYSDYANRVPRGRTYVRNGSVVDLQIAPGDVRAMVSGSELYRVTVKVSAVPEARWSAICTDCADAIDSLVELLQGRFSKGVMERICQQRTGLFPAPAEIKFKCSCPDWASMCKHVAAVLYGVGARLDERPELLFRLRRVDEQDLVAKAGGALPLSKKGPAKDKVLASGGLSELFGLELGETNKEPMAKAAPTPKGTGKRRGAAKARSTAAAAAAPAKPAPPTTSARSKRKAPKAKGRPNARARKGTTANR
ncbi:MAG: hypothetical protein A2138_05650 [Deltaproteobacteria bacterium RBG_16_71_12]|nr:MAG: hypothetical protein A2138_05650 [Deltaproteobacteria bacterium RBG_16_71_12]